MVYLAILLAILLTGCATWPEGVLKPEDVFMACYPNKDFEGDNMIICGAMSKQEMNFLLNGPQGTRSRPKSDGEGFRPLQ